MFAALQAENPFCLVLLVEAAVNTCAAACEQKLAMRFLSRIQELSSLMYVDVDAGPLFYLKTWIHVQCPVTEDAHATSESPKSAVAVPSNQALTSLALNVWEPCSPPCTKFGVEVAHLR